MYSKDFKRIYNPIVAILQISLGMVEIENKF